MPQAAPAYSHPTLSSMATPPGTRGIRGGNTSRWLRAQPSHSTGTRSCCRARAAPQPLQEFQPQAGLAPCESQKSQLGAGSGTQLSKPSRDAVSQLHHRWGKNSCEFFMKNHEDPWLRRRLFHWTPSYPNLHKYPVPIIYSQHPQHSECQTEIKTLLQPGHSHVVPSCTVHSFWFVWTDTRIWNFLLKNSL